MLEHKISEISVSERMNICLRDACKSVIPILTSDLHKGSCGRVGILGGNNIYSGAPYFAGVSALRVGADLVTIYCYEGAKESLKSYSPDIMVCACIDSNMLSTNPQVKNGLQRNHSLVIGPGLGKNISEFCRSNIDEIISLAIGFKQDLVFDADGIDLYINKRSLFSKEATITLTPNIMEFKRLYAAVFQKPPPEPVDLDVVAELSRELNCCILCKGNIDLIACKGIYKSANDTEGSFRRCGGQGDILSGILGVLSCWARKTAHPGYPHSFIAAHLASSVVKRTNYLTFQEFGRSMLASDMIRYIGRAFEDVTDTEN